MIQSSQVSNIEFTTHTHAVIRRPLPTKGTDLEPDISRIRSQDGNSDRIVSIRGANESAVSTTPYFVFDSIEFTSSHDVELIPAARRSPFAEKVTSLAIDLGISSSIWQLGASDAFSGNNKSEPVEASLVGSLLHTLFKRLDDPADCDASHIRLEYSMKIKCYEVFGDQIRDLLGDPNGAANSAAVKVREHPTLGTFVSGLTEKACHTAEDAYNTLQSAFQRRIMLIMSDSSAVESKAPITAIQGKVVGSVGTVIVTLEVQQTLISRSWSASGSADVLHRGAVVQINTLADAESLSFKPAKNENICILPLADTHRLRINSAQDTIMMTTAETVPVQVNQLAAGAKAMISLSRVLTALQQNLSVLRSGTAAVVDASKLTHVPYRESTLTRVLQLMLEGRYVNYVHCHLNDESELTGATSATTAYALRLSMELRAGVVSRVSPNEQHTPYIQGDNPIVDKWVELVQETARSVDSNEQPTVSTPSESDSAQDDSPAVSAGQAGPDAAAFWNLLHSLQASRLDAAAIQDLEALQRERDSLLRSLDGIVVPTYCHNVNSSAAMYEGIDSLTSDGGSVNEDGGDFESSEMNDFPTAEQMGEGPPLDGVVAGDATAVDAMAAAGATGILAAPSAENTSTESIAIVEENEAACSGSIEGTSSPGLAQQSSRSSTRLRSRTEMAPLSAPASAKPRTAIAKIGAAGATVPLCKTSSAKLAAVPPSVRSQDSNDVTSMKRSGVGAATAGVDKPISRTASSAKISQAAPVLSPVKAVSQKVVGNAATVPATATRKITGPAEQADSPVSTSAKTLGTVKSHKREFNNTRVQNVGAARDDLLANRGAVSSSPPLSATSPKSLQDVESALVVRFPALQGLSQRSMEDSSVPVVTPRLLNDMADSARKPLGAPVAAAEPDVGVADNTRVLSPVLQNVLENAAPSISMGVSTPPTRTGTANSTRSSSTDRSGRSRSSSQTQSLRGSPAVVTREQSAGPVDALSTPPRFSVLPLIAASTSTTPDSACVLPRIAKAGVSSPGQAARNTPSSARDIPEHNADALPSLEIDAASQQSEEQQKLPPLRAAGAETSVMTRRSSKTRNGDDAEGSHLSELESQFLRAVSLTNLNMMAQCIRMKVNVHVKNGFGRDAMQIAARNGCVEAMNLLHEHGGTIGSRGPRGDTLYHLAAGNGHIGVLQWLSENVFRGAGLVGNSVDMYGQTAAHVAAHRGEVAVLRFLHDVLNVDVMQEDFDGRTPLQCLPRQSMGVSPEGVAACREFLLSIVDL